MNRRIAIPFVFTLLVLIAIGVWLVAGPASRESEDAATLNADGDTFTKSQPGARTVDGATNEQAVNETDQRTRLERSFRRLSGRIGEPTGVSFGPLDGGEVITLGKLRTGVAWSTSKVPVAIAVLRSGGQVDQAMVAAITESSNEDAKTMWSSLGAAESAGRQVDDLFAEAGDERTMTQTEQVRPPYTAFGQTVWSLRNQQRFARWVACSEESRPVFELMGRISKDQSWGLGTADPSARFKGGWGPTTTGKYLVRQFGVIDAQGGQVAVAIMTEVQSGELDRGSAVLDRLATWVKANASGSKGC